MGFRTSNNPYNLPNNISFQFSSVKDKVVGKRIQEMGSSILIESLTFEEIILENNNFEDFSVRKVYEQLIDRENDIINFINAGAKLNKQGIMYETWYKNEIYTLDAVRNSIVLMEKHYKEINN